MKLSGIHWLADENIQFPVIEYLRKIGWKVDSIKEMGWDSKPDAEILDYSFQNKLGILTQDIDFGELVFKQRKDFLCITRLWPGHCRSDFIINNLQQIVEQDFDAIFPFLLTIELRENSKVIGIRIRQF
jgi:predicted nuclease of predicted toxin-antitoxin system